MRLFVAFSLPDEVRGTLRDLIDKLSKECPEIRWVRLENVHVTLKFIGHVDPHKVEAIGSALHEVRSAQPIEMHFRGMGFFPNERRPRVAWCGVEGSPLLAKLAADMESALEPLGIPRETRAYTPHLTLARIHFEKLKKHALEKLVAAARQFASANFGSATETEFHLYQSMTKPSGAEYKRMQSFSLLKGTA